jgi:hypothetical protein
MGKLLLGVATLALSAGAASAQVVYPSYSTLWVRLLQLCNGPALQLLRARILGAVRLLVALRRRSRDEIAGWLVPC